MTILYGWGPMFGSPSPSPFVMKADIHMQMFDIPLKRATANLDSVSKRKAPYVEDDGQIIEDSNFIRWHFEKKLGVDLDAGLDDSERATAWAFERLLEDRLNWIQLHDRWMNDENFARGPILFFAGIPEPMRTQVVTDVREALRGSLYGQGIGRHSHAERMQLAAKDIEAVAAQLGHKAFMMKDYPTALDAVAYGVLTACTAPIFDNEVKHLVASHANLVAYLKRMEERFFAEDRWPSMMPEAEAA